MANKRPANNLSKLSYQEFVKSRLPLYTGQTIGIKIRATTYEVSKNLLCSHSPYFKARLEGGFIEAKEQSVGLEETEGVVTNRSFEMLLQWLYVDRLVAGEETPADWIYALIEFARLADMLGIERLESKIAYHIRETISANPPHDTDSPGKRYPRNPETNIYHITPESFLAAGRLPKGNMVRSLFAKAVIEADLFCEEFKFWKELQDVPDLAVEILAELKATLGSLNLNHYKYADLTSDGEDLRLYP